MYLHLYGVNQQNMQGGWQNNVNEVFLYISGIDLGYSINHINIGAI